MTRRILFTSVLGPYAQDEYGSRAINPTELYQSQPTRVRRPFSPRMFHRSWGLMIRENIAVPNAMLDFPTRDRVPSIHALTPVPGTPLFEEHKAKGTLLDPEWEDGGCIACCGVKSAASPKGGGHR